MTPEEANHLYNISKKFHEMEGKLDALKCFFRELSSLNCESGRIEHVHLKIFVGTRSAEFHGDLRLGESLAEFRSFIFDEIVDVEKKMEELKFPGAPKCDCIICKITSEHTWNANAGCKCVCRLCQISDSHVLNPVMVANDVQQRTRQTIPNGSSRRNSADWGQHA